MNRRALTMEDCVVTGNSAKDLGFTNAKAGGIASASTSAGGVNATAFVLNSAIVNNSAPDVGGIELSNCDYSPSDPNIRIYDGHNASNDTSCGFVEPGDVTGVPLELAPLAEIGATSARAPLPGTRLWRGARRGSDGDFRNVWDAKALQRTIGIEKSLSAVAAAPRERQAE